uniref:Uncharacterized protein n=1 Tax=uncultured prokaryote TaxID=198431 RepID=A0A0H5Q3S2_9ZZZZ|nr:hypothetical protein [uncultured prokaryote]
MPLTRGYGSEVCRYGRVVHVLPRGLAAFGVSPCCFLACCCGYVDQVDDVAHGLRQASPPPPGAPLSPAPSSRTDHPPPLSASFPPHPGFTDYGREPDGPLLARCGWFYGLPPSLRSVVLTRHYVPCPRDWWPRSVHVGVQPKAAPLNPRRAPDHVCMWSPILPGGIASQVTRTMVPLSRDGLSRYLLASRVAQPHTSLCGGSRIRTAAVPVQPGLEPLHDTPRGSIKAPARFSAYAGLGS